MPQCFIHTSHLIRKKMYFTKTWLHVRQLILRHFLPPGFVYRCFCGSGKSSCAKSSSEDNRDHTCVHGWVMPHGRKSSGQGAHSQMSVTVHITSDMSTRFNHMLNNKLFSLPLNLTLFCFYYVLLLTFTSRKTHPNIFLYISTKQNSGKATDTLNFLQWNSIYLKFDQFSKLSEKTTNFINLCPSWALLLGHMMALNLTCAQYFPLPFPLLSGKGRVHRYQWTE